MEEILFNGPWLLILLSLLLIVSIILYRVSYEGYIFTYGPVKGYDPYKVEPKPVCKSCPGQNGVWKYA